jgi:RNase adaptor protein for sRNA GlmZ degradation
MQAMGSYGYRGYFERKELFLKSIPYAVENIGNLLKNNILPVNIPELNNVFKQILVNPDFRHQNIQSSRLHVEINSFSYKKSLPTDNSGNGGGFVFDCRFLPNPGRFEEYKSLTGQDEAVKTFLRKEKSVNQFLDEAFSIVKAAVKNYIHRDFEHLQVNFGCTGGQHRSVYCAEELALRLKKEFPIKISLTHLENNSHKNSN